MRIVGCFLKHGDEFVILYRHRHKPDGDTWGLPGGKVEPGESDEVATLRELAEETGYYADPDQLELIGSYRFISSSGQPYDYTAFQVVLTTSHEVQLESNAHSEFRWVTAETCDKYDNLIPGFHELLRLTGYITAPEQNHA